MNGDIFQLSSTIVPEEEKEMEKERKVRETILYAQY